MSVFQGSNHLTVRGGVRGRVALEARPRVVLAIARARVRSRTGALASIGPNPSPNPDANPNSSTGLGVDPSHLPAVDGYGGTEQ